MLVGIEQQRSHKMKTLKPCTWCSYTSDTSSPGGSSPSSSHCTLNSTFTVINKFPAVFFFLEPTVIRYSSMIKTPVNTGTKMKNKHSHSPYFKRTDTETNQTLHYRVLQNLKSCVATQLLMPLRLFVTANKWCCLLTLTPLWLHNRIMQNPSVQERSSEQNNLM